MSAPKYLVRKNYTFKVKPQPLYGVCSTTNEVLGRVETTSKDLVLLPQQVNIDSIGLSNNGQSYFIKRVGNELLFSDESYTPVIDLLEIDTSLLDNTDFSSVPESIKRHLIEGVICGPTATFPFLGHTTDSLYFKVSEGVVTPLYGRIDYSQGKVYVYDYDYDDTLTSYPRVYCLINTTKLTTSRLGTQLIDTTKSGIYSSKYVTSHYLAELSTNTNDILLTLHSKVIAVVTANIKLNGIEYVDGDYLMLFPNRYIMKESTNGLSSRSTDSLEVSFSHYYQDYIKENYTSIDKVSINTKLKPSSSKTIELYYLNDREEIDGKESLYIY